MKYTIYIRNIADNSKRTVTVDAGTEEGSIVTMLLTTSLSEEEKEDAFVRLERKMKDDGKMKDTETIEYSTHNMKKEASCYTN